MGASDVITVVVGGAGGGGGGGAGGGGANTEILMLRRQIENLQQAVNNCILFTDYALKNYPRILEEFEIARKAKVRLGVPLTIDEEIAAMIADINEG